MLTDDQQYEIEQSRFTNCRDVSDIRKVRVTVT